MAHEIENMFSVKDVPWHGLGRVLPESPDWDKVLELAGLDWLVATRSLTTTNAMGGELAIPNHQAIVRASDDSVLGVTTRDYKVVQNDELLAIARPLFDAGHVTWETAGSLQGGKRVWFLGRVKSDPIEIVPGDPVLPYLLLSNSHDGSLALRAGFNPIRVVCANTLAQALSDKAGRLVTIRHAKGIHDAMKVISESLDAGRRGFTMTAEQFQRLAKVAVTGDTLERYTRLVFAPNAKDDEPAPPRLLEHMERLVESGRGTDVPGVKGTLWAAYNAVTEYTAYERGNGREARLDSNWFGGSAVVNRRALDVAIQLAA